MSRLRSLAFSGLLMAVIAAVLACAGADAASTRRRAVAHPSSPVQWKHDDLRGAVFYEIFVRSFADSNGDGVGDLNGLIAKLDYLNDGNPATTDDLGVDGIWLMPVFESPSYHGYDTVDYETIDAEYGTNADFARLLDESHRRGIRVIVDLVMNHTSNRHPWFLESASSPTSPKRDWYVWNATNPGWKQPWGGSNDTWHPLGGAYYYGVFWGGMPDLNFRNAEAKAAMFRIARSWLLQGVDGFRLDATRHLVEDGAGQMQVDRPETHAVLKELGATVRNTKADSLLVAENWTDTPIIATYYGSTSVVTGGDEMPMGFNFPLASAILDGVSNGRASGITAKLREIGTLYPAGVLDAPFLTNHDQTRLATVVGGNGPKMRNAAAILLTVPGVPFLYYGEEVGIANGPSSGDESKRTPMPWTAAGGFSTAAPWFDYAPGREHANVETQTGDSSSLLSRYRALIRTRKSSDALRRGTLKPIDTDARLLAFTRTSAGDRVLVVHNLSDSLVSADLGVEAGQTLFADPGASASGGRVTLPPRASGMWRLE